METPLSDLYALGATMHHLLTGRDPTTAQPLFHYPPVRSLNPRVSEVTSRIVARALQNDPHRRYQSAAEMKRDVDRVLNPPGVFTTFRGRALAVLVGLLFVAALATDAYEHGKSPPPPPPHKRASATPALPTATAVVVVPASPPTQTPPVPPPATVVPTATALPSPATTATPAPTNTPLPPTPSVGREIKRVPIPPTISTSFTTADNMIIDGDATYPGTIASSLAGDFPTYRNDIGRVVYTRRGGQVVDVPVGNGATKIFFDGPVPDWAVEKEVQVPLQQHGCLGTCRAVQVFLFDGTTAWSTCVYKGHDFDHTKLVISPDPPCL